MSRLRRLGAPKALALGSFIYATAVGIWLATWPCFYSGLSSQGSASSTDPQNMLQTQAQSCSSLVAVNGKRVLIVLAVPILIAALGLLGVLRHKRWLALGLGLLLFSLCLVGLLTIGVFYMPGSLALIASGVLTEKSSAQPLNNEPAEVG